MPRHAAGSPMLWNKRAVRSVELACDFTLHDHVGGWRLAVTGAGSVEVRFLDGGGQETVPVAAGDRLVSTADDLFLFRGDAPAPADPGPAPADPGPAPADSGPAPTDSGPAPAQPAKGGGR